MLQIIGPNLRVNARSINSPKSKILHQIVLTHEASQWQSCVLLKIQILQFFMTLMERAKISTPYLLRVGTRDTDLLQKPLIWFIDCSMHASTRTIWLCMVFPKSCIIKTVLFLSKWSLSWSFWYLTPFVKHFHTHHCWMRTQLCLSRDSRHRWPSNHENTLGVCRLWEVWSRLCRVSCVSHLLMPLSSTFPSLVSPSLPHMCCC